MFGSSNPFGQSSSSNPFGTQTQPAFGQANNVTTNPFGQPSNSSPFGTQTQPAFGQANNATSNLFGQPSSSSPFGTQTQPAFGQTNNGSPFGAQTGLSSTGMFGGTSTGMFGVPQASSPFGASSQGFGGSTPAFGASSAPAFGNSASPFGGTSPFGQKSVGLSTPQSNPFGSNTQQSQPAFGNNTFGASSTPAFGSTNTPAFGAPSTNPFGATSSPAFGTSPTPPFGSSGNAFGNNAFGSGNAFGSSSSPAFGASSSPAFGASSTPAFGAQQSTPAFGAPSNSSFSFASSPAFGQPNSAFASGSTQSPFGNQGAQPSFSGQTNFGGQQGGSRVMPYASTTDAEPGNTQSSGKLLSISAMPVYKDKSHEELRWEDHQRGDKGGQAPAGQSTGGSGFDVQNSQPSLFSQPPTFSQPSANPPNPFGNPATTNPFGNPATTNPFGNPAATNPFAQKTPTNTSPFSQPTNTSLFGTNSSNATSVFGTSSTLGFNSSTSLFSSSAPAQGSNSGFNMGGTFNNSQSAPVFNSTPSLGQTGSAFAPGSSPFTQNTTPVFPQTNNFSTPSSGFASLFSTSPSLTSNNSPFSQTTPAGLAPNQSTQQTQPQGGAFSFNTAQQTQPQGGSFSFNTAQQTQPSSSTFNFNTAQQTQPPSAFNFNLGQTQTANTNGLAGGLGTFSQGNFAQVPPSGNSTVVQQNPVANPFGTLPVLPQMSLSQGGNSPSIQYGISSMPVVDKSAPVRGVSPLLTSRHLLQRRVKQLPARKYRPGDDSPKIPFFSDEENSNTPKADAFFIPRENPRALFIRPVDKEKSTPPKDRPTPLQENGKTSNGVTTNGANHESNGETCDAPPPVKANQKPNRTQENPAGNKNGGNSSSPKVAEIESLMPKLHHAEYFTEPRIQELAAKERVNPGYCGRVKDFVVGRHGYGSIRFLGETDVRKLDLEMLVQFNNREVIVYMDESKKPPVGEGLNKPAEVTLLNIKCIDKKSGKQVKEGPRVEKYKEMLKRKAEEQGAKFVSFDAVNGEWKFRVEHFSSYKFGDEDEV